MLRRHIYEAHRALGQIMGRARNPRLSYALARCRAKLRVEAEAVEEAIKPHPDFMAYERARIAAAQKHAVKDEDDTPRVERGEFVLADAAAFADAVATLQAEHADAIAAREAQLVAAEALLAEECEVEVYRVASEHVEADGAWSEDPGLGLLLEPLIVAGIVE